MQEYRIRRSGQPSLVFRGELVAESSLETDEYAAVVRVHRTVGGRWVVTVLVYYYADDRGTDQVAVVDNYEDLRQVVQDIVPEALRTDVFEALGIEDRIE